MRINVLLIPTLTALILMAEVSCRPRPICCEPNFSSPQPLSLELVDKTGKSLLHSIRDSVKISFVQGGKKMFTPLNVQKLKVSATDTTTVKNYNGLVITDRAFMVQLSSLENPVNNFTIYLNGLSLGEVYLRYRESRDNYTKTFYSSLTFNGIPVTTDQTFAYYTGGTDIYVFQTL